MSLKRWSTLEFQQLEYVIAVKNHQSFVRAAIALGMDQGSLSKQIKQIEAQLGFALFNRKTRPLGLTDAGAYFLEDARELLMRVQKTIDVAQDIAGGSRGKLAVGINTSIANSHLPAILQTFCQQFPDVELVLHELASYDQIKYLRNKQIEVGFFHKHTLYKHSSSELAPEDSEQFHVMPVLQETLVAVLPSCHRLAHQSEISLLDLNQERFVLPPHTLLNGLREQIDRLCVEVRCCPIIVQEAAWMTTVLSLVAGNMGVSLLPSNVRQLQRKGVVYCDVKEATPGLEIVAVARVGRQSAVLQNFLTVVEALAPAQV